MSLYFTVPICGTNWSAAELRDCAVALVGPRAANRLRSYIGEAFGAAPVLFNSGRSALEAALARVRELTPATPSRSVLVPSLVCAAVPRKVVRAGMTPVFYDIGPDLAPSARSARSALRPDTVAVVHPYLYGKVSAIEEMAGFAREKGLFLIEDCAAAFLLRDRIGRLAGTTGDFAIFSFQEGKTLVAGSGGALIDRTSPPAPFVPPSWSWLQERRLCLSKVSFVVRKVWKSAGYALERCVGELGRSFADRTQEEIRAMAAVDARLVLRQIARWPELFARKRAILDRYGRNLAGSGLRLPQIENGDYAGRLFLEYPEPVVNRPDDSRYESEVIRQLHSKGIATQLPYFPAHRLTEFARWAAGSFPCSERISQSAIEVPTQTRLRDDQIDYVCECLLSTVRCTAAAAK